MAFSSDVGLFGEQPKLVNPHAADSPLTRQRARRVYGRHHRDIWRALIPEWRLTAGQIGAADIACEIASADNARQWWDG